MEFPEVLYNVEKTASDAMNHKIADLERRLIQRGACKSRAQPSNSRKFM